MITGKICMHGQYMLTDYFYQMTLRDDIFLRQRMSCPKTDLLCLLTASMILGACVDDDDGGAC